VKIDINSRNRVVSMIASSSWPSTAIEQSFARFRRCLGCSGSYAATGGGAGDAGRSRGGMWAGTRTCVTSANDHQTNSKNHIRCRFLIIQPLQRYWRITAPSLPRYCALQLTFYFIIVILLFL